MTTTSSQTNDTPPTTVATRPADPGPAMAMAPEYQRRLWGTCAALARSDWLPDGVRGKAGNIFAVALLGEQFKLDAMPAILNIHIIESQNGAKKSVVLSAQLWIKLARDAGHKVRAKKGHPTEEECTVYLWRADERDEEEPYEATYTLDQARRAGLVRGGSNYEKNPEDMLFARAAVRVIRRAAGEVALANAIDEYEAEAMQREDAPQPTPPAAANLAEAAAARESAAAQPDVTDAEVVPEPVPDAPTPDQVADLERRFTPTEAGDATTDTPIDLGPRRPSDDDDGTVIDAIRSRLDYIEATVPEGEAERRSAHRTWGAIRLFFEDETRGQHGDWDRLPRHEQDAWAREFLSRQDAGPKGDMGIPDAGVRPTPEEVDTTPIAEGDDLPCPTCDGILDADGNGHEPGCSRAADGADEARPPEAGDWAAADEEEPAATWTPTQPDPWGVTPGPEPKPETPKRKRGKKQ